MEAQRLLEEEKVGAIRVCTCIAQNVTNNRDALI